MWVWALAGLLFWCVPAIGIVIQFMQGSALDAVLTDTSLHGPHRAFSQLLPLLTWATVCAAIPVAIERASRAGGALQLLMHLLLASGSLVLGFLMTFSGHLGVPPVTPATYLRFRVLHTIALPFLGTIALLCWYVVVRRYRVEAAGRRSAPGSGP
jgi:hypothetical protein